MTERREFDVATKIAIVNRASDSSWRIHCERCGLWCKSRRDYQIDHVIPEGMRPLIDKERKLSAADGQLLCLVCHDEKTDKDKSEIGLAKRQEAYDKGIDKPRKRKWRRWPPRVRERERPPAVGKPRLMREGFVPVGDVANNILTSLHEERKL